MNTIIRTFVFALFLLAGNAFWLAARQQPPNVFLSGRVKNFNNQVVLEDMSAFQYLKPATSAISFLADDSGSFACSFYLEAPSWFRLGRNQMYLCPGDRLELFVDKNDPRNAQFKGKGAEANLFLRYTAFPKGGSFLEAGRLVAATKEQTVANIEKAAAYRGRQLDSLKGTSKEFIRLERARIKADWINSLQSGEIYSVMRLGLKGDTAKAFASDYRAYIQPLIPKLSKGLLDASLMQIPVYRDIASDLLEEQGPEEDKQAIRDWMLVTSLLNQVRKQSNKDSLRSYRPGLEAIQTSAYREAGLEFLKHMLKFGKGDPALSFVARDSTGRSVELSSLKGKLIYLDLWATWCGPCLAEMPYFEQLKEKYKDRSDIVFVSLSIDDSEVAWKNSLRKRKAAGVQWIINRADLADYDIVTIPRTIIIDRDFRVADMNAPEPSDKATIPMIDDLLVNKKN